MGSINFDESRWPILVVRFSGALTDAEFETYLSRMGEFLGRRETMCTILDASASSGSPPKQRARQAEWIRAHTDELKRHSVGTAFVITSTIVRGVLTAILWLQPMPVDHVVVATLGEAERWARERLRARGVTPKSA